MAHPKGFEPLTPRFVVWCSIQLSYGCLCRRMRSATNEGLSAQEGAELSAPHAPTQGMKRR